MKEVSARRRMIKAAMSAPYLAREEEHDLAVRWKDAQDQQALHKITTAHMRLVIAMASRFRNFGLPMSDLVQEGHVGLLEAAARFEPERGVRFSTYATWWIRASMQDYILRNWSIVRGGTSSAQKALFFNLRRLRAKLSQGEGKLSESAMHAEIASALGVQIKDVASMDARLSGPDTSLNAPMTDSDSGSSDRMEFLPSDDPLPDEQVGSMIDDERRSAWLMTAMGSLNERELRIIRERRLAEDGATLESLGAALGISKERVRQIESRALQKLKAALVEQQPAIGSM
ncbi:RNA polymerase factor sigma-32 [Pararhizobium mangrovi]|uniref:RNA polymerase factor sigma-32 n=1 Tax=Pararhizobium mangrovi TaxID=2590452 RepID=A0A506U8I2_9HYPH|nr:RNA polymerase factor sigma-32 [Pararhizobium mangrovi]TPW30732.1 RNA polymerase factor sigma-32 [Pararhizobium mangrovi]